MYYGCDMGYKMAENDLRNYAANKTAIINLREQIKNLEDEAGQIRSATADATPVQGGGSTREDRILSNIHMRDKLAGALKSAESDVARVERALALLDDEERLILNRFYINRHKDSLFRLMEELGIEQSAVYERKSKAFFHFRKALYPAAL